MQYIDAALSDGWSWVCACVLGTGTLDLYTSLTRPHSRLTNVSWGRAVCLLTSADVSTPLKQLADDEIDSYTSRLYAFGSPVDCPWTRYAKQHRLCTHR